MMIVPQLATVGLMVVTLTAGRPVGAQELRPEVPRAVTPETGRPDLRLKEECRGVDCPQRKRTPLPPEHSCRGHNPELGPPCASRQ